MIFFLLNCNILALALYKAYATDLEGEFSNAKTTNPKLETFVTNHCKLLGKKKAGVQGDKSRASDRKDCD